jgi:ferredoxin
MENTGKAHHGARAITTDSNTAKMTDKKLANAASLSPLGAESTLILNKFSRELRTYHPIIILYSMAYMISKACTKCGACLPECPTGSITDGKSQYYIDSDSCADHAACVNVCPVNAISKLPESNLAIKNLNAATSEEEEEEEED